MWNWHGCKVTDRKDTTKLPFINLSDEKSVEEYLYKFVVKDLAKIIISYTTFSHIWNYVESHEYSNYYSDKIQHFPMACGNVIANGHLACFYTSIYENVYIISMNSGSDSRVGRFSGNMPPKVKYFCSGDNIYVLHPDGIYIMDYNKGRREHIQVQTRQKEITLEFTQKVKYIKDHVFYTNHKSSMINKWKSNGLEIFHREFPGEKYPVKNINLYINRFTNKICSEYTFGISYCELEISSMLVDDYDNIIVIIHNEKFNEKTFKKLEGTNISYMITPWITNLLYCDDENIIYTRANNFRYYLIRYVLRTGEQYEHMLGVSIGNVCISDSMMCIREGNRLNIYKKQLF